MRIRRKSPSAPRSKGRDNLVVLSDLVYRVVWIAIAGLHLGCAAYLLVLSYLYRYIDKPYLDYYADLLAPASARHLGATGTIFGSIGALHLWSVIELCTWSMYDGEMVLSKSDLRQFRERFIVRPIRRATRFVYTRVNTADMNHQEQYRQQRRTTILRCILEFVCRTWSSLFGRHGIFGVDGEHFEPIFALRQLIEVISQTYQAYRACQMISTAWLSRFYVVLTIVNCLSTPIFHGILRTRPALGRLCCVLADIVLNIGTSILIPIIVFFPYYRAWDHEHYTFDIALLYNDVWYTNMIMENQLLFTVTGADFVTKLVPHLSIWLCLINSRSLLTRKGCKRKKTIKGPGFRSHGVKPYLRPGPTQSATTPLIRADSRKHTWITHTLFVIAGVAICIIHFFAEWVNRSPPRGCMQSIRPWFATKPACSVFMYNVIEGQQHDLVSCYAGTQRSECAFVDHFALPIFDHACRASDVQ